jgi:prephenate dehydrogenase
MKPFRCVAIVGVGLIGGSIGLALRKRSLAERVVGIARRQETLRTARRVGAVTNTSIDLAKGVAGADLVVVCTPVGSIVEHVRLAAENCAEGALITDAGSTKRTIVESLDGGLPRGCRFLGSHPVAGSEKTGPGHAHADLFEGRVAILTPTRNTRAEDFDLLEDFWSSLGSMVIQMSAEEHDEALALTSHLPHAVAAVLATLVPEKYFRLTGSGFLDTTRIAAGDPPLWGQIFQQNRDNLLTLLDQFMGQLRQLSAAIRDEDILTLQTILAKAKTNRDALGS